MNRTNIDAILRDLDPGELPDVLSLLAAMETAEWVTPREAEEWRAQIGAWGILHEDRRLWMDRPEA
ncbi:MAG: hypothetical protein LAO51_16040 [Acidobacteriia bacterium]|nr:hypothetical protein [Terriglobia bacterium]